MTQDELFKILGLKKRRRMPRPAQSRPDTASLNDLNDFLADLKVTTDRHRDSDEAELRRAIRKRLAAYPREELQRLMARAYTDALKSPSQKQPPKSGRGARSKRRRLPKTK
jgi:hypothetical protein